MKEKITNTKNNKHKLYKALSIAGVTTLVAGGLIGIGASVANIVTTKDKNLGTDYGQGLNFNLQFSLNNPSFSDQQVDGMMASLQTTANALSSKLYQLGLKQIRLTPRIQSSSTVDNKYVNRADLKNVYGVIDVNVDSQEGTRWHLDPKVQALYVDLTKNQNQPDQQKKIIEDYAQENYPDEVDNDKKVLGDLAQNAANKLALYFAVQNTDKVSLAASLNQPILNNTNQLEFQNVATNKNNGGANESLGINENGQVAFKALNNSKDNTRLVEIDNNGNKTINFELDIPDLTKVENYKPKGTSSNITGLNSKGQYLDLSGFMNQFNDEFKWEDHNDNNPDNQWKTMKDVVDQTKADNDSYQENLGAPNASWILWTNRSGLINRLNYLTLLATLSNEFSNDRNRNTLAYQYWDQLIGDENNNYDEFKNQKKPINGKLINDIVSADNEETRYYYWVKNRIAIGTPISTFFFNYDAITANQNPNLVPKELNQKLIKTLDEFYEYSTLNKWGNSSNSSESDSTSRLLLAAKKTPGYNKYNWLYSWNFASHDLIAPYANVIDYANFYTFFDLADLNDVFGKSTLKTFNNNNATHAITKYNSAFTNKIYYNTKQNKLADAQPMLDNYTEYNYQNSIINVPMNEAVQKIMVADNTTKLNVSETSFENFVSSIATLSPPTLAKSVIGLSAWSSILIGISVVVLVIGIIISILYRVPGVFATITTFLAGALSLIAYRSLSLTFSFDTAIALMAGVFISFITIINFLSYIPRLLKEKNLNLKFGVLRSFKYFAKNSLGIHVTAIIIALVFLYFGQFQIQGFGAMLVINTLMSLLFNVGIFIGFVSILAFGLLMYQPSLMFNKSISNHLTNIELTGFDNLDNNEFQPWYATVTHKITFNKWWTWMIGAIIGFLSILGIILLVTNVGHNEILGSEVMTLTVLDPNAIGNLENLGVHISNNFGVLPSKLIDNPVILGMLNSNQIQLVQENNYITSMVIESLVHTCLIAMGFCLIWSLLWLNFINIINVFVVQLISLLTFGLLGIFQLPININVIIMMSLGFLINNVMIYSNFINLKFSYEMKSSWTNQEIHDYVLKNQQANMGHYFLQYLITIVSLAIMMIFVSRDNISANGMLMLDLVFNLGFMYVLIPYLFMGMMMAREKYIVKAVAHRRSINHVDYDKVDEQAIIGINKHVYNPL